jgi:hypothetical protein
MIMDAGRDRKSATGAHIRTRYYIAAAASLAAIVTVTAILVFQFRQTAQQPGLAVVVPDTVLKLGGELKSCAPPDTMSANIEVVTESGDKKVAMPMKIDQGAEAPALLKIVREIDATAPQENEASITQMTMVENEVTVDEEISYDAGQISAPESTSGTVGGVQMSSQNANYNISNIGKRTLAEEMEVLYEDTVAEGNEIFITVEQMPSFPGGDTAFINFMAAHLRYPAEARESNVSGRCLFLLLLKRTAQLLIQRSFAALAPGAMKKPSGW